MIDPVDEIVLAPGADASSHAKTDPWAHRRAEPRLLILCWTFFLLATTILAIAYVGLHGAVLQSGARTAARIILLAAAIAIGVLWPMIRLSQRAPRAGAGWAVRDAIGIVLPLQAVIWPHIALAAWPVETAAAVSATTIAWCSLIAALLALAFAARAPGALGRTVWMLVFVLLAAAAPVGILALRVSAAPAHEAMMWLRMASLVSAVDEFAPTRSDHWPQVAPAQWAAIGCTCMIAAAAWLPPIWIARGRMRRTPLS